MDCPSIPNTVMKNFFGICWKRSNDRSGHCGRFNDLKALLKTSGKINTLDMPFEMKKLKIPLSTTGPECFVKRLGFALDRRQHESPLKPRRL